MAMRRYTTNTRLGISTRLVAWSILSLKEFNFTGRSSVDAIDGNEGTKLLRERH